MAFKCLECGKDVDYYEGGSIDACTEHKDIVDKKRHDALLGYREDEFDSFGSVTEDGGIVCPYCFEDATDFAHDTCLRSDGDTCVFTCDHCRNQFEIELSVTYSYKSTRKE